MEVDLSVVIMAWMWKPHGRAFEEGKTGLP